MSVYVVDTCVIREMLFHFRREIPTFYRMWDKVDQMIENGEIVFVKESFSELKRQCTSDENLKWLKSKRSILLHHQIENVKL